MTKFVKASTISVAAVVAVLASVFATTDSVFFYNKPEVPAELK